MGWVMAGVPAIGAVQTWLGVLVHPDLQHLAPAGQATAIAVGFALFIWAGVLRVRLELSADGIAMVNPWGTQRLPWSRVASVSMNDGGVQFHTPDGFTYRAVALNSMGGRDPQDERLAEIRAVVRGRLGR